MGSERSLAGSAEDPGQHPPRRTREALLDAALESFSRHGFRGTSVRDLARAVGIQESSVYKHFASKQAIFDALVERADQHLAQVASQLGQVGSTGAETAPGYQGISEEDLLVIARGMFDLVLDDPQLARLRRLMTIEQYHDPAVSAWFHEYFMVRPLVFQTELFQSLFTTGDFRDGLDPEQTALAFFGPIFLLIQYADGGDRSRAQELLAGHVRHFRRTHLSPTVLAEE